MRKQHPATAHAEAYIRSIQYDELEAWTRKFAERQELGSAVDERCLLTLQTMMSGLDVKETEALALAWVIASERQTAMI